MSRILPLAFFVFSFLLSACSKGPLVVTSEDFMTCNVNGHGWIGRGSSFGVDWTNDYISIRGRDDNMNSTIIISIDEKNIKSGTYPLSEKNVAWYDDLDVSLSNGWKADSLHTGSITIKLDEKNRRVTGSFSFKAKFDLTDDVVNITKGQFSLVK